MNAMWRVKDRILSLDRPLVMGIVNVTPDSFYDGGRHAGPAAAVEHGNRLAREGADILDIGGESSRPGSTPVSAREEKERVVPVIAALAEQVGVPISCDTTKSDVAEAALAAGAHLVNDISAARFDARMPAVIKEHRAGLVLMHMLGTPKDMQQAPSYRDTIGEIRDFLAGRLAFMEKSGVDPDCLAVDPGIGFGKRIEDNLVILKELAAFLGLGRPLVVGASRKFFIGKILDLPVEDRLEGSLAAAVTAFLHGARIFRVHDVKETRRALDLAAAIGNAGTGHRNTGKD